MSEGTGHDFVGHFVLLSIVFFLLLGVVLRIGLRTSFAKRFIPIPYTAIIMLVGILFGSLHHYADMKNLNQAIEFFIRIDPHIILFAFIPALVFESAFAVDSHIFGRIFLQALSLAGLGVIVCITLTALFLKYAFPYNFTWAVALMLSSLISATDPVAVVSLLKDLGVSKRLAALIEGESLLNDGTAFLCFLIFKSWVAEGSQTAGQIFVVFLRLSLGGPAIGIVFGIFTCLLLHLTFFDEVIEMSITFFVPLLAFWVAEIECSASGVLCAVTMGLFVGKYGRPFFSSNRVQVFVEEVWGLISYIANTLLFAITGILLADRIFITGRGVIQIRDYAYLLFFYVSLQIIRGTAVFVCSPILYYSSYGLSFANYSVITWGGLRGAIAVALALMVEKEDAIGPEDKVRIMFHTCGIVMLTILVNGITSRYLLQYFKMGVVSPQRLQIIRNAVGNIHEDVSVEIKKLQQKPFYKGADWLTTEKFLDLNNFNIQRIHEVSAGSTAPGRASILAFAAKNIGLSNNNININNTTNQPSSSTSVHNTLDNTSSDTFANFDEDLGDDKYTPATQHHHHHHDPASLTDNSPVYPEIDQQIPDVIQYVPPKFAQENTIMLEKIELRRIFLNHIRHTYNRFFYEERVLNLWGHHRLLSSVDIMLDDDATYHLNMMYDMAHLDFAFKYDALLRRIPIVSWIYVHCKHYLLLTIYQIGVAFTEACRKGLHILDHSKPEIRDEIVAEIVVEMKKMNDYVISVAAYSPSVVQQVQTRHAVFHLLRSMREQVEEGYEKGIFTDIESEHLTLKIENKIKSLTTIKFSTAKKEHATPRVLLTSLPSLLPFSALHGRLDLDAKIHCFEPGSTLFNTSTCGKTIFIITKGIVCVTSREYDSAPGSYLTIHTAPAQKANLLTRVNSRALSPSPSTYGNMMMTTIPSHLLNAYQHQHGTHPRVKFDTGVIDGASFSRGHSLAPHTSRQKNIYDFYTSRILYERHSHTNLHALEHLAPNLPSDDSSININNNINSESTNTNNESTDPKNELGYGNGGKDKIQHAEFRTHSGVSLDHPSPNETAGRRILSQSGQSVYTSATKHTSNRSNPDNITKTPQWDPSADYLEKKTLVSYGNIVGTQSPLGNLVGVESGVALSIVEAIELDVDTLEEIFSNSADFLPAETQLWRCYAIHICSHLLHLAFNRANIDYYKLTSIAQDAPVFRGDSLPEITDQNRFPLKSPYFFFLLRGFAWVDLSKNVGRICDIPPVTGTSYIQIVGPTLIFPNVILESFSPDAVVILVQKSAEELAIKKSRLGGAVTDFSYDAYKARSSVQASDVVLPRLSHAMGNHQHLASNRTSSMIRGGPRATFYTNPAMYRTQTMMTNSNSRQSVQVQAVSQPRATSLRIQDELSGGGGGSSTLIDARIFLEDEGTMSDEDAVLLMCLPTTAPPKTVPLEKAKLRDQFDPDELLQAELDFASYKPEQKPNNPNLYNRLSVYFNKNTPPVNEAH